jgi:transposase
MEKKGKWMQVTRGYRTELDLNNQQVTACKKHAGAKRWAWNWGLHRKQEVYQQTGKRIDAIALHRELNQLKHTDIPWMYDVSKTAPQEALRDLDTAFDQFFQRVKQKKEGTRRGAVGYPKYKTKRTGLGSFRLTGSIHIYENAITLPRLGTLRLHECGYLPTSDVHILSATISEEAGAWMVSVQVEETSPDPPTATGAPMGVDLGIKTLAQSSDGRSIANPKALHADLKKLTRLHRRLSRKEKGSKNRAKARQKLARQYARVAHVRRDALHKGTAQLTRACLTPEERAFRQAEIATSLPEPKTKVRVKRGKQSTADEPAPLPEHIARRVKEQQIKKLLRQATATDGRHRPHLVIVEDLNVDGMKRNRRLARAISDVGLGEFKRQMSYKSVWQGETLCVADRWYPSTKMCSGCGHIKEEMDLSERVYVCEQPQCHLVIERDLNASYNLAALGRGVETLAKAHPTRSMESLFHEVMKKAMQRVHDATASSVES